MELKYDNKAGERQLGRVLIVPLWNWNKGEILQALGAKCFNCTFMELKWTGANGTRA